jgi:hypothetical protein
MYAPCGEEFEVGIRMCVVCLEIERNMIGGGKGGGEREREGRESHCKVFARICGSRRLTAKAVDKMTNLEPTYNVPKPSAVGVKRKRAWSLVTRRELTRAESAEFENLKTQREEGKEGKDWKGVGRGLPARVPNTMQDRPRTMFECGGEIKKNTG